MVKKVPNQRTITVNKECGDKVRLYTKNCIDAIDEAAGRLHSQDGFKLYMYLAKNQDKYQFNLSSTDYMNWSRCGYKAYKSAFEELVKEGYLILKEGTKTVYTFYDKSRVKEEQEQDVLIEIPKEKVEEVKDFVF